jgi:hypothetical protein
MSEEPKPGTRWRHLKTGHVYVVLDICTIEATVAPAVLYQRRDVADAHKWVRPLAEFMDGRFAPLTD